MSITDTVNNLEARNSSQTSHQTTATSATFKVSSETRCKAVTGVPLWKYLHPEPTQDDLRFGDIQKKIQS